MSAAALIARDAAITLGVTLVFATCIHHPEDPQTFGGGIFLGLGLFGAFIVIRDIVLIPARIRHKRRADQFHATVRAYIERQRRSAK